MTTIKMKRAYQQPDASDGYRILVDRLWPRGLSHEKLDCEVWDKEISPSNELREWYHADPENRWADFIAKYSKELDDNPQVKDFILRVKSHSVVTFVYGAHDEAHNNAVALKEYIEKHL